MARKPKVDAGIAEVLRRNRAKALEASGKVGGRRLLEVLRKAQADLDRRLSTVGRGEGGPGGGTFTAERMRVALAHVRAVTAVVAKGLGDVVVDQGVGAADDAAGNLVEYMGKADAAFRGVASRPMALDEAAVLDSAVTGAESTILRRLAGKGGPEAAGILSRYGVETVGHFEEAMRVGLLADKDWGDVKEDLVASSPFLQAAPRHWAERILRTETANAYNRSAFDGMKEVNDQLGGGMVKILAATFDDRTAADSYAVHGQVRRLTEHFDTWTGPAMHPPARPNDREVVVPHRIDWPIPANLAPRSPAEVAARWKAEGRKGAHPPIPPITTVPFSEFGKGGDEGGKKELEGKVAARNAGEGEEGDKDPEVEPERTDPARWEREYEHLGRAKVQVGFARAAKEHAMSAMSADEVVGALKGEGLPEWMGDLGSHVENLVEGSRIDFRTGARDPARTPNLAALVEDLVASGDSYMVPHVEAAAAVAGHMRVVETGHAVDYSISQDAILGLSPAARKEVVAHTKAKVEAAQDLLKGLGWKHLEVGKVEVVPRESRLYRANYLEKSPDPTSTRTTARVSVPNDVAPSIVEHELGHHLEASNPRLLANAKEFLAARTKGEELAPLSKLAGLDRYEGHEMARPDKFRTAYVGKEYPDATEVTSSGLEWLTEDPVSFWKEDPEHFLFTLGQLAGR